MGADQGVALRDERRHGGDPDCPRLFVLLLDAIPIAAIGQRRSKVACVEADVLGNLRQYVGRSDVPVLDEVGAINPLAERIARAPFVRPFGRLVGGRGVVPVAPSAVLQAGLIR
jgi:hypothetical protein